MNDYTPINKGQMIIESDERAAEFERRRGHGHEADYAENRRQWWEYPKKQHVADYPLHVDMELASVCNLRCPMCYTITKEFKALVNAKLMDFDLYQKVVEECGAAGVYSLRLSFRGESFLHKRIVDCVRVAKAAGIKEVSTLTNGLRLDEAMFEEMMDAGIDWITISVDGMGAVYEEIRAPAKFDRLLEKLENFKKIKEERGRVKPVIKVQSVYPAIADDPQAFYDTFAPITDQVATNPLIDYLRNDDESDILYHEDFVCPQIYQRLVVAADGQVLMCSNDETNEHVVGDANHQTIHEIWHGEKMQEVRAIHVAHQGCKKLKPCKHCYLPRKTEPGTVTIGNNEFVLQNYINRSQKVGT